MKKIICFGDTITEMGFVIELRGYAAQLADRYSRRADVLVRGFTGYTTREAKKILKAAVLDEKPDLVILQFGLGDSALPGQIQHVPLPDFKKNLRDIGAQIASAGAWLVIVSPPPVDEKLVKSHTLAHTGEYAKMCAKIADEMHVPLVNLFEAIQQEKNWTKTCLLDGLHLSANGMTRLYEELAQALDRLQHLDAIERLGVDGI
jgi:isoamyl acetate esterase